MNQMSLTSQHQRNKHRAHLLHYWTALLCASSLLLTACGGGDGPVLKAQPQALQFGATPALALNGSATVSAAASSGLPATFSSTTPTICSIHPVTGVVTALASGTCTIAADQYGNNDYAPATQATLNISIAGNAPQSLNFGAAPALQLYGTATVAATASSGLAPVFSSGTPALCSVDSSTGVVMALASGTCVVQANQPGNASFQAAVQVTQNLAIAAYGGALSAPGAPSQVSARLGSATNTVEIRFVGPATSGGSPMTGYEVTSSPSGLTASGTSSPLVVSCPSSCAGYAFAVAARNSVGTGSASALADVQTTFHVVTTFYEPDTQPNNTVFTGSFTLNSTTGSVTGLQGTLSESMTHINDGQPMTTVTLSHQLSSVSDGSGGLLVSSFSLPTVNTYAEGGFTASSSGLYFGWPTAANPSAGGVGNSFVTIYVDTLNPLATLSQTKLNALAYGDCAPGGMMGDVCMTGYVGRGTMGGYPMSQVITRP